jgi:hypothetical protein
MATYLAVCFLIFVATLPLRIIQRRQRRRAVQAAALQSAWLLAAQRANTAHPPAAPVSPPAGPGYLSWPPNPHGTGRGQ